MSQKRKPKLSSSERLPDDVVFDILVRLPVKPIIRFRCVSKPWYSIITNPLFITAQLNRSKSLLPNNVNDDHNGYLLCTSLAVYPHHELSVFVRNSYRTFTQISGFEIPFSFDSFVGFCNGIYCFFEIHYRIYLWNPVIKKFKILTPTLVCCDKFFCRGVAHGLVYHSQTNDFKILRILFEKELPLAEVYTLSTDSWRSVEISVESLRGSPIVDIRGKPFVFVNGALHSLIYTKDHKFILCFDLNEERFREIMLPQNYFDEFSNKFELPERLAVFKGFLALVVFGGYDICQIWVMMEYGVVESWTKITVPFDSVLRFLGCIDCHEVMIKKPKTSYVPSFDIDSLDNNLGIESLVLLDG
uniref:F-box domain-containing protein n=1 Tax=Quercus lobata TaxID=97700 RepID=A0A7N2M1L9_QUELO